MESSRHKGIIIRRVTEHHKLGTSGRIRFLRILCGFQNDFSHQPDGIHIDSRLGRTQVYGAADSFRSGKSHGNGADQKLLRGSHSLGYQSGIAADKVYSHFLGRFIQSVRNDGKILRSFTGRPLQSGRWG